MSLPAHIHDAIWHYIPVLEGWTEVDRACEMAEQIITTNAKVCVDIGVYAGRSSIAMAFAARELGDSIVYAIDPWQIQSAIEGESDKGNAEWWAMKSNLEEMHRQTMKAVWDHRLEPWLVVIRAASQYTYKLFPSIDLINIDGQHAEVASCRDVELYLPRVKPGGIVFFDDTSWPQTQKAIGLIEKECELVNVYNGKNEARTYRKR